MNAESDGKLTSYRTAAGPLPDRHRLWPLYGAGFANLGVDGAPLDVPLPGFGPDELLVRHDAVGICFSDIKVIRTGPDHPRIHHDMSKEPVVLGHEVALTVAGVGVNLRDRYTVGDRFIVQADIYVNGVNSAYGYSIPGGLAQYGIVDERVLNGDDGTYLVPVRAETGYAEAALNEPWACVEASYTVTYRTAWRPGGTVWLTGDGVGAELGRAVGWQPARVFLDVTESRFAEVVRAWADGAGVDVLAGSPPDGTRVDDIVVLSADPELIEGAFGRLANGGVFNVVTSVPVPRDVRLDVGRMHYDHLIAVGTAGEDLSAAYATVRTEPRPGGAFWVLGAGGPIGHMHLQRAAERADRPGMIVATNRRRSRLHAMAVKLGSPASGIEPHWMSQDSFGSPAGPANEAGGAGREAAAGFHGALWELTAGRGFDDIAVLAPSAEAIEGALVHLANHGVMNMFAGVPRGTLVRVDVNAIVCRGVRVTGTSGSSIGDLRRVLDLTESGVLSPGKSVAAIAGLEAVPDALQAVAEGRYPGKVVIFPNLRHPLPLTPLDELHATLPDVAAHLDSGNWTVAAERELLRSSL